MNVQKRLLDALVQQLETTPIDDITVADLTKAADISRQTFYRAYPDKYELLKDFYAKKIVSMYDNPHSFDAVYQASYRTICYFKEHPNVARNMFFSRDEFSLKHYLRNLCYESNLNLWSALGVDVTDENTQGAIKTYSFGTVSLLMDWLKSGMPETPEKLTRQLMYAIPVGVVLRSNLSVGLDELNI